ncbi:MAG: hypothetical protein FJ215_08830 [Ignavibacteria bacterium]|nr:hypothetical protein [Ignavibacteria bacterium]
MMKYLLLAPKILGAQLLISVSAPQFLLAQTYGTDSHSASVTVSEIALLSVNTGVTLNVTGTGTPAGQDLMTATDQSSTLWWGLNGTSKKITVRTNLTTPLYSLKVEAVSPTQGIPASTVTISTAAKDLITGLGLNTGSCTLLYTAEVLASAGTGTNTHTITFTVQNQ